jgi:hypothetical protein
MVKWTALLAPHAKINNREVIDDLRRPNQL